MDHRDYFSYLHPPGIFPTYTPPRQLKQSLMARRVCKVEEQQRLDWAVKRLMECRSTTATVACVSEHWGISRRQARRVVGAAHNELVADIDDSGVNRQQMVAQLTHGLMEALGKAIASDQPAAVVGCARELNSLLGLAAPSR